MRIGMILDTHFPPSSRIERQTLTLIEQGFEVFVFCFGDRHSIKYEKMNNIHICRYSVSTKLLQKFRALAYTIPFFHWFAARMIQRFLMEHKIDIIHVHNMVIFQAVLNLKQRGRVTQPLILDLHENRPEIIRYYTYVQHFPGRFLTNLNCWRQKQIEFVQKADRVLFVTREALSDLQEYQLQPNAFVWVPNFESPLLFAGCAIDQATVHRLQKRFSLLYWGDLGLRRGTDTTILAVAALKRKIPNIQLVLVGTSRYDIDYLHELVCKHQLEDHVVFEGWQDLSLLPSYLQGSTLGLCPFKRNRHHDTTYANKLFHYMLGGKPVLASNCPTQQQVIEDADCGMVFEAENVNELAEQIFYLYQHPKIAAKMGSNGQKAITEKYNWEIANRSFIEMYYQLKNQIESSNPTY